MPILKNVLGLDVGSHSLKAVEFRQTFRGLEAVQLQSAPRDDEIPLPELVRHFMVMHRLPSEHVVTALPGDRLSARRLHFPFRERRRIAQAVPFAVEDELPFELDEFVVDWQVAQDDRTSADVIATIAPRQQVSELLELLAEAGCPPRTLEAEGLVLGNLAGVFDLTGTRLLADLGHRKSTFCVVADGQAVWARTVPVAGDALTRALAQDKGVSRGAAERSKCEEGIFGPGLGPVGRETAQVVDRLVREIVRTLGAAEPFLAAAGQERVEELTLFGGTALLDRIDEVLGQRVGIPAARLGLPRPEHAEDIGAGGPPILFAPAIALGLRGTSRARTRVNFRQDEFAVRIDMGRYRRDFRSTAMWASTALVLAALGFTVSTALESRRAADLEGRVARLYQEAFPGVPVPASVVPALREAVRSAGDRAEFLGVYRGNLSALDLLVEISRLVPPDLEIVFEELTIDRQLVRMRVYAQSFEAADRLGAELAKFGPFESARIGAIETDRRSGGKRFNVTISLASAEDRA